jgi:hypothetical protein
MLCTLLRAAGNVVISAAFLYSGLDRAVRRTGNEGISLSIAQVATIGVGRPQT